jgi:hypothetical protein
LISEGVNKDHIILFAFDSADDLIKIGENPLILDNEKKDRKVDPTKFLQYISQQIKVEGMYYLLLDEVQKLGAFESVLNGFLRKKNLDVYVTGSNSKFLSKDILSEFAGRGDEIHMLPFSEFYSVYDGTKEDAFDEYCVYGGLPAVVLMKSEEEKTNYLITQINNLYLKDIINRYHLQEDTSIGELLDVISSGISTLTNPRKLALTFASEKHLTLSDVTISRYIEHFEDAFMIKKVNRYDVKGKNYIATPYKIYFEDIGLRNVRINFRQIEGTHIMENIIYNELRYRGYNVDVGVVESRERTKNGKEIRKQLEIDFIATLGSKKYYIQSAYAILDEDKYLQETRSFDKVNDSFKKIILVEKSMKPRRDEKGYVCMGVKEFLLNEVSLDV